MIRTARVLGSLAGALALVGCTGPDRPPTVTTPDRPPTGATSTVATLGCGDAVHGDLGEDWRSESVVAGPLAFARLLRAAREPPIRPGGGAGVYKALAVVEPAATVTVAVGSAAAGKASLNHASDDPGRPGGRLEVADGSPSVTFQACPDRPTAFSGNILVDGARCVPLEFTARPGEAPRTIVVSLGAGTCQ